MLDDATSQRGDAVAVPLQVDHPTANSAPPEENGTSRVPLFGFIVSQTVSTAYAPDRPEEPVLPDPTP